jgi:quinoprotein glucose dehydrogenase
LETEPGGRHPAAAILAQSSQIPAGDGPNYNRDLSGMRYSPLSHINTENVAQLAQAWSYSLRAEPAPDAAEPGATPVGTSAAPIVVNGVMYLPAGKLVLALDAGSGKEL